MTDCIFCKIITGDIPPKTIYEDDHTLAFLDVRPMNKGHTLVIPKKHYDMIFDVPEDVLHHVMSTVKKVAAAVDQICDGINIAQNNRRLGGQTVNHIHVHIMPRYEGDGLEFWPQGSYKEGEAEETLAQIKSLL